MQIPLKNIKKANPLGELLRDITFDTKNEDEYGCYSCFEVCSDFREVTDKSTIKEVRDRMGLDEDFIPTVYENSNLNLLVGWCWESDGILYFKITNDQEIKELINIDCKKSYTWEYIN